MATFSNLGIKLIQTGEESGTWGTSTNTNFDIVDQAIGGYVSHTMSDSNLTLVFLMELHQMLEIKLLILQEL